MQHQPKSAETCLADAIGLIGAESFEAALWELFQSIAKPDNLLILACRDAGAPVPLYRHSVLPRVFGALERTYLAGAYRLDPYFGMHLNRVPDGAYRLRDIAPDAFHRSRYCIEYYAQTTLVDEIAFLAWPAAGVSISLSLGRDAASQRVFSSAEVDQCRRLAPVVSALVRGHWRDIGAGEGPAEDTSAVLAAAARRRHGIALSARQAQVALLILRGHSTVSIGLNLGLSPQTVKVFRKQLYRRCEISSQAELFALMLPLLKDGV